MQSPLGDILHLQEIRELIKRLQQMSIEHYCSPKWYLQDQALQKLNLQLHVNAVMKNDEYILEECITQDKFKLLIYDLILTAIWKKEVFPRLQKEISQCNSLKLYLALYHQAVLCNLLEVLMFHRTAIDQSGEYLIELIDYCYKKITRQLSLALKAKRDQSKDTRKQTTSQSKQDEQKMRDKVQSIIKRTPWEQAQAQAEQIEFNLFIMSISILRYVTDYIRHLEIGIVHHLLVECNIFSMLVPLLEEKLWLRTNSKGEREIFENSRWVVVPKGEYGRLPKTEAQVWIAIYNLFMDPECRKKYELNDERKNTLLRLRKYMNEVLLDQIPNLSFMLRSLQELSMMNLPTHLSSNPFVVQQLPLVAGAISQGKDWQIIANQHAQRLQSSLNQAEKQYTTRLADLYSNNNVQGLIDGFKCAQCGKEAFKRCSKCKNSWYCSKDCQVKHWPAHKAGCNQRAKQMKQAVQTQPDKTSDNKVSTKVIINTAENPSPKVKTASIDELD